MMWDHMHVQPKTMSFSNSSRMDPHIIASVGLRDFGSMRHEYEFKSKLF